MNTPLGITTIIFHGFLIVILSCMVGVTIATYLSWFIEVPLWFHLTLVFLIKHISALYWIMFVSSIYFDISRFLFDNYWRELFIRYSSYLMPLRYIFLIYFKTIIPVSCLCTISFCVLEGVLKVISDFTSLLNTRFIFAIMCDWEILRSVLSRSRLIMDPTNSSSIPVCQVVNYLLVYSIILTNYSLSLIDRISYMYTTTITVLRLFILYKIKVSVLYWLNHALRVMVLMYSLSQWCTAYMSP